MLDTSQRTKIVYTEYVQVKDDKGIKNCTSGSRCPLFEIRFDNASSIHSNKNSQIARDFSQFHVICTARTSVSRDCPKAHFREICTSNTCQKSWAINIESRASCPSTDITGAISNSYPVQRGAAVSQHASLRVGSGISFLFNRPGAIWIRS